MILKHYQPNLCIKNTLLLYSIVRHRFFSRFSPVKKPLTNKTLRLIPLLCSKVLAMFDSLTTSDVEAKDERTHLPVYGCGGKGWKLCDIGWATSILKYPIYSMEVNNPTSTDIGGVYPKQ